MLFFSDQRSFRVHGPEKISLLGDSRQMELETDIQVQGDSYNSMNKQKNLDAIRNVNFHYRLLDPNGENDILD